MTASDALHLFVYGSLQTSANHRYGDLLRRNARLIGTGSIQAHLYIVRDPHDSTNAYPGAVPSADPANRVFGELYALGPDSEGLLEALDEFEHCSADWPEPREFLRCRTGVVVSDGVAVQALAYLYAWDVSGAQLLSGGRFLDDGADIR